MESFKPTHTMGSGSNRIYVEAWQWDGSELRKFDLDWIANCTEPVVWMANRMSYDQALLIEAFGGPKVGDPVPTMLVYTYNGQKRIEENDWIVRDEGLQIYAYPSKMFDILCQRMIQSN